MKSLQSQIILYPLAILYSVEMATGTGRSADELVVLSHSVLFDSTNTKPPASPSIKNSPDLSFRVVT